MALQNLVGSSRPRRRLIRSTAFLATCAFLITISPSHPARAWETDGHVLIADVAVRSLPIGPLRGFYTGSLTWFETNSSFPDRWRLRDNAEAPRHFLNTEAFGTSPSMSIPVEYKDVLKSHTYDQLRTDGVLPWTVDRHYKLLVSAFREKRWSDAMVQSLYLSNYVGDACSPFHATANFDGQLSIPPQAGIASRFEKQVVQRTIKAANLRCGVPTIVHDPKAAMIGALEESLHDVPSLLAADKEAVEAVKDPGGKQMYDEDYWASFLPKARPIAVAHLESGGHLLAGILWEAWQESGRPTPPAGFSASDRILPYSPPAPLPIDDATITAARSEIKTITIPSKRLGKSISVNVLLPQRYDPTTTRYPVLYLLHGSSGGYQEWNDKTGLAAYLRDMPFIVVMPDANGDSWYVDSPHGGRYTDFFYEELMTYIEKHYATINRREGRAIAGNSMGGYGAWYLALRQPRRFAATASLSGALHFGMGEIGVDENGEFAQILFGDANDPTAKREYVSCQILPLIEKLNFGSRYHGPALYFDDGKDDYLNGANRQMEQSLLSLGIPYEYAEFDGSHDWTYWNTHIRDVLQFLQLHLASPEPNRPSHHLLF